MLIGVVTVFSDFPTDTIIWTVWAIAYQQIENNLIQPQIQKRTVNVQPRHHDLRGAVRRHAPRCGGCDRRHPDRGLESQILLREYVDIRTLSMKTAREPPPDPADPRSLERMSPGAITRRGLLFAVTAISLYLLAPALLEVFGAFDELDEISPLWFPGHGGAPDRQLHASLWGIQKLALRRRSLGAE